MTCQHQLCECEMPAAGDDRFCSPHCESAVTYGKTEDRCHCEHASCKEIREGTDAHATPPPPLG